MCVSISLDTTYASFVFSTWALASVTWLIMDYRSHEVTSCLLAYHWVKPVLVNGIEALDCIGVPKQLVLCTEPLPPGTRKS